MRFSKFSIFSFQFSVFAPQARPSFGGHWMAQCFNDQTEYNAFGWKL